MEVLLNMKHSKVFKSISLLSIGLFITFFVYNTTSNYSLKELIKLNPFKYDISVSILIISLLFYSLGILARAFRLLYLNDRSLGSVRKLIYLQFLSTTSQLLLPFRLGDGVRVYIFRKYFDGIAESAFLFVVEKILDTITLLSILIFIIWSNKFSIPFISDSRLFILFSILITSLFIIPDLIDIFHRHLIVNDSKNNIKIFFLKISKNILLGKDKTLKKIEGKKINILFLTYIIWAFDCLSFTFIVYSLKADQAITFLTGGFVALSSFLPSPPLGIYGSVNIGFYWSEITSGIKGLNEYSEIYSFLIYGSTCIITLSMYIYLKLNKNKKRLK